MRESGAKTPAKWCSNRVQMGLGWRFLHPATISELNKKAYVHIEDWRNRPLQGGRYPYVYVDGIYLRRNWGGEFEK